MQPIKEETEGIYRFDVFELDPTRRLLFKDGQVVQLTPKTFDTLLALVRNRGRVMEKDELMQAVWPDTIVEETNLAHNISALRKIFGQKGSENRFILTSQGRGYSFVAEALLHARGSQAGAAPEAGKISAAAAASETAQSETERSEIRQSDLIAKPGIKISPRAVFMIATAAGLIAVTSLIWAFRPARVQQIQSVAVLPFKPLVADFHDEVLEMGIADTLISRLSALKQLSVRPISAVRQFTALDQDPIAAGRELQVQAVLEGSIQRAGSKIRINARLLNIADGKPLWTRQFDEQWTDIFAVQDAISERVAGDLMVTLSGQERTEITRNYTTDPEAYQLYLMGRYHWNKRTGDGIRKSIEYFQQAIEKDPQYALAFVGLADAYTTLGSYHIVPPKEALPLAHQAAQQALAIDNTLAEAHATLGKIITDYYWDWERAEKEFQLAIEMKPNYANAHHWRSTLLSISGREDEAIREANRAFELDYLSPAAGTQLGSVFYRARRYDQAIAVLRKTLDLEPNFLTARFYLGLCYLMQGHQDEAVSEFQKGREIAPGSPDLVALLGYVRGLEGKLDKARQHLDELNELAKRGFVSPSNYACIYAGMGDMDMAFKWMEKSYEERSASLRGLKSDPLFDKLRRDSRFDAFVNRVGFQ